MKPTIELLDSLQELVNIGVGRAAGVLNDMLDSHIDLQIPLIDILPIYEVKHELEKRLGAQPISAVKLGFSGTLQGNAQLVFPTDSASKLVAAIADENFNSFDLDSLKIGTLTEIGNIIINGVMGSISNLLKQHFNYSLPLYVEDTVEHLLNGNSVEGDATIILAQTSFRIEQMHVNGDIILMFRLGSFERLLVAIDRHWGEE